MSIPTPVAPTATEPTDLPRWASTDIANGPGGANNVIEPSEAKKDIGWNVGERPPREYMNWFQRMAYQWTAYLDSWVDYWRSTMATIGDNWAIDPVTTAGLTFGFKAGQVRIITDPGSHNVEGTAAGTVALTNGATNTVFYNATANAIQATTSYTAAQDRIPLYSIVTSGGAIVWASSFDLRTPHSLFIPRTFLGAGDPGYVPDPVSESNRVLIDTGAWAVAQSLIAVFAGAGDDGLVPDPVTENGYFLRDDGTWALPTSSTFAGWVDTAAGSFDLPAGWSVSLFSTGRYIVTHNLGLSTGRELAVAPGGLNTGQTTSYMPTVVAPGLNAFEIDLWNVETGSTGGGGGPVNGGGFFFVAAMI